MHSQFHLICISYTQDHMPSHSHPLSFTFPPGHSISSTLIKSVFSCQCTQANHQHKGYFDDTGNDHQSKRRHVQTNGHVAVSGRKQVEEKRLVETLQQIVETAEHSFHHSENRKERSAVTVTPIWGGQWGVGWGGVVAKHRPSFTWFFTLTCQQENVQQINTAASDSLVPSIRFCPQQNPQCSHTCMPVPVTHVQTSSTAKPSMITHQATCSSDRFTDFNPWQNPQQSLTWLPVSVTHVQTSSTAKPSMITHLATCSSDKL